MLKATIAGVLTLLSISGCRVDRVPGDVSGRYLADYEQATEELVLLDSHSFHQKVHVRGVNRTVEASGTWTFDRSSGYVTFDDGFILVIDGFRRLRPTFEVPERDSVVYPAHWGLLGLYIGTDEGVLYKRQ